MTPRMAWVVPHSHNQTITVGFESHRICCPHAEFGTNLRMSARGLRHGLLGDYTHHSQRSITAGGDLHPALRIAPKCESTIRAMRLTMTRAAQSPLKTSRATHTFGSWS